MISKEDFRTLAEFNPAEFSVTSFYLNVDGRERSTSQYVEVAHQLVRSGREQLSESAFRAEAMDSVARDLDEIVRFVGAEFDREARRGVALFSCSTKGFRRAYALHAPAPDAIFVRPHAVLRPLLALTRRYPRCIAALVDREKARFFLLDLGMIQEMEPLKDEVPGRGRMGSYYGLSDKRMERHVDDQIHQHFVHVAERLGELAESESPHALLLGGPPDTLAGFRKVLPHNLSSMVAGEIHGLMIIADHGQVAHEAERALIEMVEAEQRSLVRELEESDGPTGIRDTLQAIFEKNVRRLIVSPTLHMPGFECRSCGRMSAVAARCPACGSDETTPVPDVVEEAVRQAILQDAAVEVCLSESAASRVAAIAVSTRFAPTQHLANAS